MSPMYFSLNSAFMLGLMGLALNRYHLLSALLCLESMLLTLFITIAIWTLTLNSTSSSITPMILLTFSACEASAGLAILVATSRSHGSDNLQNLNLLQC
ncbi:NADH dehydrogenase subunit 4L (mitochondrion) [Carcharodon carcharias]|uniref:NADH-ubiquinone oxidoreductase chain 4L n=1 Tax=Carcharodon carcharias TaxID=13397 RepID=T1RX99_CARCH|nr:NADH dehydrogenase subunit 4L [Carcharodon carcharias]AGO90040.1 NADH dehydrogenase subunit 4L [Carcharodon carcharias]AIS74832.1 NADH dehydrogenase subunit 4L [Carcharodon carcharias]APQ47856.1 NADH dehydrogenase subunit 4L [Carcharodon carcharias]ARM57622.1 NADH dehydrogenase subunit 4L [Carcharodon carcharias]ARM57635.1 NADH dehydrogenase subunit 4L [Carcharodon carcharias]